MIALCTGPMKLVLGGDCNLVIYLCRRAGNHIPDQRLKSHFTNLQDHGKVTINCFADNRFYRSFLFFGLQNDVSPAVDFTKTEHYLAARIQAGQQQLQFFPSPCGCTVLT